MQAQSSQAQFRVSHHSWKGVRSSVRYRCALGGFCTVGLQSSTSMEDMRGDHVGSTETQSLSLQVHQWAAQNERLQAHQWAETHDRRHQPEEPYKDEKGSGKAKILKTVRRAALTPSPTSSPSTHHHWTRSDTVRAKPPRIVGVCISTFAPPVAPKSVAPPTLTPLTNSALPLYARSVPTYFAHTLSLQMSKSVSVLGVKPSNSPTDTDTRLVSITTQSNELMLEAEREELSMRLDQVISVLAAQSVACDRFGEP